MTSSAKNLVTQLKKTFTTVSVGYKNFKDMDEAVRGSGSSFSDYIRWASESEEATEAFGLATLYAKARVIALNMAVGAGIGLVVSYFSKKIIEQRNVQINSQNLPKKQQMLQPTQKLL